MVMKDVSVFLFLKKYNISKVAIVFTILLLASCSHRKASGLSDIPKSEFDIKEMDMGDNFQAIDEGELEYRMGIGDEIKITIYGNPQDSSQATALGEIFGHAIDETGRINVPLVKKVYVNGLTRDEATEKLSKLYSKYVIDPHIMLDVVKYESQFYYIIGNLRNAGKHPIKLNTNLLEAVTEMVPVHQDTGSIQFVYLRRGDKVLPISINDLATGEKDFSKYYLKDGDTFYVPHPSANRAYILGEVKNPGAFEIKSSSYSMMDLLADAGGLVEPHADKGRIYLVRQTADKHFLAQLSFEDIFTGKAGDLRLAPGDRVLVSPTALTNYNRIIQQLLPTFQMLYTGTQIYKNFTQ
ncbi:MAG: polysaccharide biosynthesis/export family protein [bacterium]